MPTRSSLLRALALLAAGLPAAAVAHETEATSFAGPALVQPSEIVDCTLENGATAKCTQLVLSYPTGLEIGPFCPATLDDEGGIWDWSGDNAGLYRIDADFLNMLDGLGYRFFDETGAVYVTDNATTPPTADHSCINVTLDDTVQLTALIPVDPVMADTSTALGTVAKVGVALDGVPIFADAPTIQQTGHMPALDTCGGHVDPGGWYHWHATASDIETLYGTENVVADCGLEQDATAMFGYAFDGFAIYGSEDADGSVPTDLDSCNGHVGVTHEGDAASYHYHASLDFPNLPSCLVGVQAQNNFSTTAQAGIGAVGGPGGGAPGGGAPGGAPDFTDAAQKLGVSVDDLNEALGQGAPGQLDLAAAAAKLGVTESALREALPPPPNR